MLKFCKNHYWMSCTMIFDPLRKKEVPLTPEENVRQWFIGVLKDSIGVPEHLMMSEVELKFGIASKIFRADILIYDRQGQPLAIVECKRPEVALGRQTLEQALRYDMVLGVRHFIITNGTATYFFSRKEDGIVPLASAPNYEELCRQ